MKKVLISKNVLVLHGFPGLSRNDPIRSYLSSRGYNTVIPDLFDSNCEFKIECLVDYIEKLLGRRKPDVIIAASLGGFIAPYLALRYPASKLVLIATGPRLNIGIPVYNLLVKNGGKRFLTFMVGVAQRVPTEIYRIFYKVFNPYKSLSGTRVQYENNIVETFMNFRKFPKTKTADILKFVNSTDNTDLLKRINNKTLILCGGNDLLMPGKLSKELNSLIKNSVLIENTGRLHYQVFDERDFEIVDDFVNSK